MKTLLLLRHAKSDWSGGEEDFDRPLNERGRAAAARMAAELAGEPIDAVICSPSVRTRQTLELLALRVEPVFEQRIYEAGSDRVIGLIAETDDRLHHLLLIGHMPAIAGAAMNLAGGDTGEGFRRLREGYPTAALAKLNLDVASWRDVRPGCARVERFVRPRELA
ncbi:SixA phosphatase family protein [Sphingomonas jaspsi]|uniref:SixA phosphatase family protein n=1 Tax=Sphingomonas jaspsi TaxID=392409 RepID=UPI0004B16B11|nr:histidine phosphatase family protein [Sphingomonas jaspsi]